MSKAKTWFASHQGEARRDGEPLSDEERAKSHFNISDEEWDKLSDEEKRLRISQLPPRGTGPKELHSDFQTVLDNYRKHYGVSEGEKRFLDWLYKYQLDPSKPYSNQAQLYECFGGLCEAFRWTEPLIQLYKADDDAKYYKTKALTANISMNRRDYSDVKHLKAAAPTLTWRPLNLNHDHAKFLPFPEARVDWAAFEDNAVECVIRIPNKMGELQKAIENGDIIHVSIEGEPRGGTSKSPEMYNFTALALLEKNVTLPGDPLTYLEPLFMRESLSRSLVESLSMEINENVEKTLTDKKLDKLEEYVKAPLETPWDFDASKYDIDQLRYASAVVTGPSGTDGEYTKNDCHLPHHLPGDGKTHGGTLIWRGVAAAGAILKGARGGVNIGSEDKAKAKTHLGTHYREFDKIPPWEQTQEKLEMTEDEIKGKIKELEQKLDKITQEKPRDTEWDVTYADLQGYKETLSLFTKKKVLGEGIGGIDVCGQCKSFQDLSNATITIEHATGGDSVGITRTEGAIGPGIGRCAVTEKLVRKQDAACTDGRPRESATSLDRTMEDVKHLAETAELLKAIAFEKTLLQESRTREEAERHAKIKALQENATKDEQIVKLRRELAESISIHVKTKEELENLRKIDDSLKEENVRYKIGMENSDRDIKLYKDQNDRYERSVQKLNEEIIIVKEELTKTLTGKNDETAKRAEAVQRAINADSEKSRVLTESALIMQHLSEKTAEISDYAKRLSDSAGRELKLQRELQEAREGRIKLVDEIRDMKQKLSKSPREIQITI